MSYQDEYEKRLKKALNENLVTFKVSAKWYELGLYAFLHVSPISSGLTSTEFLQVLELLEKKEVPTYYQFGLVNNCIETRSFHELGLSMSQYKEALLLTEEYANKWNVETEELRVNTSNVLMAELQQKGTVKITEKKKSDA